MKSLKKNILYNSGYQFLILALPFITAPYLSRVIGATGVGTYSYSYSVAQYFIYLAMLGLANYGNRSIAVVNGNRKLQSKVFSEIYCMQLVTAIFSIVLYIVYVFAAKDKIAALIQIVYVLSALFDINWLFFGTENFKITVLRNTIIKFLSMIAIFALVKTKDDTYIYITIMAFSTLASQIAIWPFVKTIVDFKLPPWTAIKHHFKPNVMLFVPVIAISIYKIMSKIMLGQMATDASVGYYEYAEKIYNIPLLLITAIGTVMLPRMTYLYSHDKLEEARQYFSISMEYVLAFANAAMFGLIAISKDFVIVYFGADFEPSAAVLNYLAITIIFLSAGNVLRTQYLIPRKLYKVYINSAFYGAIINFIVNYILIPRLDMIGAAIGIIVAETVVFFYQLLSVRKEVGLSNIIKTEITYGLLGLIMYLAIFRLNFDNRLLTILIKIVIGVGIYTSLFLVIFYKKYKTSPLKQLKRIDGNVERNK